MRNIQVKDSYNIWDTNKMKSIIDKQCYDQYGSYHTDIKLHRTYTSMYVEWWLHNIGYYVTKPVCKIEALRKINLRCKDVDINELR